MISYQRSWNVFCSFLDEFLHERSVCPASLMLFMAFLRHKQYKPSTISTYVSEIRYMAKLQGFQDPGNDFLVTLSLAGLAKLPGPLDARLPITVPIMKKLLLSTDAIFNSYYDQVLFKSMLLLAFFAFLRVGEFTVASASDTPLLTISSLVWDRLDLSDGLSIQFLRYKHSKGRPFLLHVPKQSCPSLCPVLAMAEYLNVRVQGHAALFVKADGRPVTTSHFRNSLNMLLTANGLDTALYKSHSFRIGAASYAAEHGLSDAQIRLLGRWRSDTFKKYIRNASFSVSN